MRLGERIELRSALSKHKSDKLTIVFHENRSVPEHCGKEDAPMRFKLAVLISERTGAETVQVIGKRIVLYKPSKTKATIVLPK